MTIKLFSFDTIEGYGTAFCMPEVVVEGGCGRWLWKVDGRWMEGGWKVDEGGGRWMWKVVGRGWKVFAEESKYRRQLPPTTSPTFTTKLKAERYQRHPSNGKLTAEERGVLQRGLEWAGFTANPFANDASATSAAGAQK